MSMALELTQVKVEPRRLLKPRMMGLLVLKDDEPGHVRSYSMFGWQRYPMDFLLEYSIPLPYEAVRWLVMELLAKGYECSEATEPILIEKEIEYEPTEYE